MARPAMRLRLAPSYPSRLLGTTGISVTRAGGSATLAMDWSQFDEAIGKPDAAANQVLLYDPVEGDYVRTPLADALTASYREVTVAGDVTVAASDGVIGINKAVAAPTAVFLLPASTGTELTVKDAGGDAASNAITLTPDGAETIDGASSFVMNRAFQAVTLAPVSGGWVTNAEYSGNSPVFPGTYTFATVGVDQSGRVTSIQSGNVPSVPPGVLSNAGLAASVAASALTITLTTASGSTPSLASVVSIPFRSATSATGTVTQLNVSSATTLVISSGSTLGFSSATAARIWIVAFDDGGTVRLGAINCRTGTSITPLSPSGIASSTAEGGAGAADSASVFYTGTAVTSKAYTILGFMEWSAGLTTAGTWAIVPTKIEPYSLGMKMPGDTIQRKREPYTTYNSTAGTGAFGDNKMQSSEGTAYLSASVTPSSAANVLLIEASAHLAPALSASVQVGIFQDAGAAALSQAIDTTAVADVVCLVEARYDMVAGTTSSTTFTGRAAASTGSTYINGNSAGRRGGGALISFIQIEELAA